MPDRKPPRRQRLFCAPVVRRSCRRGGSRSRWRGGNRSNSRQSPPAQRGYHLRKRHRAAFRSIETGLGDRRPLLLHGLPLACGEPQLAPDEAHDLLGLGQDRLGDGAGAPGAVGEDAVDLGRDRPSAGASRRRPGAASTRQDRPARLELREGRAAELAQHRVLVGLGEARRRWRRDCPPRAAPPAPHLSGKGSGSVLAFLIFSAMASASSVRLMRECRTDRTWTSSPCRRAAHDPRGRPADQRLGQREEPVGAALARDGLAKSLLNFCAMSRASSRCCFWSSPTGTWVAL